MISHHYYCSIEMFGIFLCITVASWTYDLCDSQQSECYGFDSESRFNITEINLIYQKIRYYDRLLIKNDISSPTDIEICFDNLDHRISVELIGPSSKYKLKIETSIQTYSNTSILKEINASNWDVIVNNTNNDIKINPLFIKIIHCKSIMSCDLRDLKIVSDESFCNHNWRYNIEQFGRSVVIQASNPLFEIIEEPSESKSIMIEPLLFYSDGNRNVNCESHGILLGGYLYECVFSCSSIKCNLIYGMRTVTLLFSNQKTITLIIVENTRAYITFSLDDGSTVTCVDGLTSDEIIFPSIIARRAATDKDTVGVTLKGNWPYFKKNIKKKYYGNKIWMNQLMFVGKNIGKFVFEAQNFPVEFDGSSEFSGELVLTQKNSSIYGDLSISDLSIVLQKDEETEFFFIGEIQKVNVISANGSIKGEVLHTFSSKLKIYAQTITSEFVNEGPAKMFFQTIDNKYQQFNNTELNLVPNGKIINPYSIDINGFGEAIDKIYSNYSQTNPSDPKSGRSYRTNFNYYLKFAKERASEMSAAFEKLINRFLKIYINPPKNGGNFSIIFPRNDLPIASLYRLTLNEPYESVCAKSGTLDKSKVKITLGDSIVDGVDNLLSRSTLDIKKFLPVISEQNITGNDFITKDNKCIGFKPTSIPGSSIELFFYTSNTTYIEILKNIPIISLLTPNDLEVQTKLINPKSKNIFIACMDDTPSDKSLNFKNGIREDANIFLFGVPFKAFDDIMNSIEYIDSLDDSSIDYDNLVYSNITKLITKYQTYIPKVNLMLGKVQTLMTLFVDFIGTNIECSNFFVFGSTFSQADKLHLSAATTITETESFKPLQIAKKSFNNLCILPINIDPPNLLEINAIQFSDTEWLLKYEKYVIKNDNIIIANTSGELKIETSNVIGSLTVFSITKGVDFRISDTLTGTVVKGAGIITDYSTFMDVKSVPGMILEDIDTKSKDSKKNTFQDFMTEGGIKILKLLTKWVITTKDININNYNKYKNGPINHNHKALKEENGSETTKIKFTGWGKITKVTGEMKIDVGKSSIEAKDVPRAVMEVVDFKSEEEVKLSSADKNIIFTKPQIISSMNKKYTFPEGHTVIFTNITFIDENAKLSSSPDSQILSLSLNIGAKTNSDIITDHLKINQATIVDLDTISISVRKSVEVGPESYLISKSFTAINANLIMNYKLSAEFAILPDNFEPASITLNYIGESTDEALLDYSQYLGATYNIRSFSDKEKCNRWKNAITMKSEYKDFQQGSSSIQLLCIEPKSTYSSTITKSSLLSAPTTLQSTYILQLKVTDIPTKEKPCYIEQPEDNKNPSQKDEDKKLPIGAIVGGVIGGVAAIAIIIILVWFFVFRKANDNSTGEDIP